MEENNNRKPTIARTGAAASSADVFSAVYKKQKTDAEAKAIEEQKNADAELLSKAPVTVSAKNPEADKKSAEDKKFNIIFIVLLILTIVLFIASAIWLIIGLTKDTEAGQIEVIPENTVSASIASPFTYERTYSVEFPEGIQEKYKNLYAQSQDFVGWITVPGTSIDMPVYQCSNNSYYLKHDNYDTYTKYGALFLDMANRPANLTTNTTIYGHNFDNNCYFDEIHKYQDPEFFKENPVIEFNTLYKDYKWKVVAAFHTNGESAGDNNYLFYYVAARFGNNSLMKFYDEIQQRSYIHTGVDVQPGDKLLTLSTCTYFFDRNGRLENARFAVIARLVRDGESEEVDTSLVTVNDNVRYPQLYYDVFGGTNPWVNASKWVPEAN